MYISVQLIEKLKLHCFSFESFASEMHILSRNCTIISDRIIYKQQTTVNQLFFKMLFRHRNLFYQVKMVQNTSDGNSTEYNINDYVKVDCNWSNMFFLIVTI